MLSSTRNLRVLLIALSCMVVEALISPDEPLLVSFTDSLTASHGRQASSTISEHRKEIASKLQQILEVVPKNRYGKFEYAAVRYMLHHFFLQHRGWKVEGLDPEGSAWNSSSPDKVVALERLPYNVVLELKRRLADEGLNDEDTITLAATIEIYIHDEAVDRMKKVYKLSGMSSLKPLLAERAIKGLELFMSSFILGANLSYNVNRYTLQKIHRDIRINYPAWPKTQEFLNDTARAQNIVGANKVNFTQVANAVENLTDRYGRWQNYECIALKDHLVQMEDHGTGRVRLADFYGVALGGKWQFTESVPYLRELGALDDTNPNNLRVIIPNYVNGASNCVGSSKYSSICCISECGAIFDKIEALLGVAEADPADIARIVPSVSSSTVAANRELSQLSLIRLKSIAANHGGTVPIHGRLFAQFLHHVYPRECDFPHRAGAIKPKDLYNLADAGETHRAMESNVTMKVHADQTVRKDAPVETMVWSLDEELLVAPDNTNYHPVAWIKLHLMATCAAIITMCMGLTRSARLVTKRAKPASRVLSEDQMFV